MSPAPEPFTPRDCDLQDFPFMPLQVARLRDSDLAATEHPEACWYAVLLWAAAWHQVPAASLPDDEMVLTRDFKETVKERAAREPAFAKAMLDEAATAFLNGEPHVARLILRDLVNASVGFEALAAETNRPSKSLHRMLSEKGNPSMDNLAAIFGAVRKRLGVAIEAHAVETA